MDPNQGGWGGEVCGGGGEVGGKKTCCVLKELTVYSGWHHLHGAGPRGLGG